MCNGKGCELKDRCYRYTATKGLMQSFFGVPPMKSQTECEYYWGNK